MLGVRHEVLTTTLGPRLLNIDPYSGVQTKRTIPHQKPRFWCGLKPAKSLYAIKKELYSVIWLGHPKR